MIDGRHEPLTPAQRLADVLVDQRDLHPPVPVEELVAEIADVKAARLRGTGLDAVLHGLTASERPTLLIDEDAPATRRRFTLGHELGHLSMAWHRGTLPCLIGEPEHGDDEPERTGRMRALELDANQFSSRLLIPRRYIETFAGRSLGEMIAAVQVAGVSAEAAIYGLLPYLPPGRALILLDYSGKRIARVATSSGTISLHLRRGDPFDQPHIERFLEEWGHEKFGGSHIFWGHLVPEMELTVDTIEWRPVLTEILVDLQWDATPSGPIWRSVNGVASAAHSDVGHEDSRALAQRIKQSFQRHETYDVMVEHPLFDDFASSRALAFAAPKRSR